MADHVLPLTHAGTATQASTVAFQAKAGMLQAQLDRPVSALLAYSCVVGHVRQAVSPSTEKEPAPQGAHTVLLVAMHAPPLATAEPAAHVEHGEHVAPPAADEKLLPATQGVQTRFAVGVHAEAT